MSTPKPSTPADSKKQTKALQIVAVIPRKNAENDADGPKGFWTRIGVAFENRDGSMNLRFDYWPTSPETTIQLRPFDPPRDGESTTI